MKYNKKIALLMIPLLIGSIAAQSYIGTKDTNRITKSIIDGYAVSTKDNAAVTKLLMTHAQDVQSLDNKQPILRIKPLSSSASGGSQQDEWCGSLWWQYANPEEALYQYQLMYMMELNGDFSMSALGLKRLVYNIAMASGCEL